MLLRNFVSSKPELTPKEKRNLILERIAFLENDQRLTAKEKRCKDQIVKDEVTSSQYDYFGKQTARIIDDVNTVTNEISGNNQILNANRIEKQKICIEETAGRIIDVVNDLAGEIRRKVIIGTEGIQMELDIIRMSTANLKDTVTALIEETRQEHHIVDDGDIAEELGYIQWIIAELMGALKGLQTEMRENQLDLQSVGIKRKLNTVAIKREVSGDDAHQRFKKTKHIATYDLAGEKRPTYGNLSAVLCELCINENEAVNWCETCNSNICVSCTCFHKDVRMMINHRIFNLP
ncbi:unnamed protein product [Mytilus edulis]|uniref:B box-type domain-containing protein n=1 Tax=Mytilus edulis TaxID=6550 RepID=A0A8S3R730_MYTED|nr:unnamed protein product [Mytilus edulis]